MYSTKKVVTVDRESNKYIVTKKCNVTHEDYRVVVPLDRAQAWLQGSLIQNAFPELSANEREFLNTGITPDEWEDMFG